MTKEKINVGVFKGRGYVGGELCRLLLNHRNVGRIIPSSGEMEDFDKAHPNLAGCGLQFVSHEDLEARANELDVVFIRGDHGDSLKLAPKLLNSGAKVIDLGPDFRLKKENYEATYGREHTAPELLDEAVYGISELKREQIRNARLIANPGCYVIAGLLGLHPLLKEGMIQLEHIPIYAINGMTGADSKPRKDTMHTSVVGNILPYSAQGHRHSGEFEEKIEEMSGSPAVVNFNVAHGDFTTGIHLVASPFAKPQYRSELSRKKLLDIYDSYYKDEAFIRINRLGKSSEGNSKVYDVYSQIKNVRGTNFCDISLDYDSQRGIIKVIVAADNLVRGSAGSAIQNMNIMFGFNEQEGLRLYSAP